MGSGVSHLLGCLHRPRRNYRAGYPGVQFSEPLDEGLGHSFCYVRPPPLGSPPLITPDKSEELAGGGKQGPPPGGGADETLADAADILSSSKDEKGDSQGDRSKASAERPGLSAEKSKTKIGPETSFKAISGASVSANTATPRSATLSDQFNSFSNVLYEQRAAAFESTSSFSAIPLQPLPRGSWPMSGPLDKGAGDKGFIPLSGPLERGFMSGPLERGFMSGPLERGVMSGPLDPSVDRSHYSAPLNGPYYESGYARKRKKSLTQFMTTVGRPVKKAFVRTASSIAKTQKSIVIPVKNYMLNKQSSRENNSGVGDKERKGPGPREGAFDPVDPSAEFYSSELEVRDNDNLQWAQGKAGEDRVHVVISEERGWIFVGIYDGFNGPDAPDFLMSNLYPAVSQELQGLLWDPKDDENGGHAEDANEIEEGEASGLDSGHGEYANKGEPVHNNGTGRKSHRARGDMIWMGEREQGDFGVLGVEEDRSRIGNGQGSTGEKSSAEIQRPKVPKGEDNSGLPLDKTDLDSTDRTHEQEEELHNSNGSCLEPGISQNGDGGPHEDLSGDICHDARQERSAATVLEEKLPEDSSNGEEDEIESVRSSDQQEFSEASSVSGQDRKRKKKRATGGLKFRHGVERRKEQIQEYFQIYDWNNENGGVVQKMKHAKVAQDPDCPERETVVEHASVLKALAKALEATENAYLDMADKALYDNPELALMGSCVLVMLMKDEDVYILNVGDSRAVLAQHPKVDALGTVLGAAGVWNGLHAKDSGARDSLLRLELERIIEETPLELEEFEATHEIRNLGAPPPTERPLLGALQLTTDHSTNIEEEVLRLKSEHPDDDIIENDRVKGKLKVTRAFGAGFLKQPKWNDALLEMFQINFVGTTPYMTCSPALYHHRLGPQDEFLVLSSDGLYQYFSNEEVVSHVEEFMKQFPDGDPAQHLIEQLLFRAAKKAGMDFHELLDIPQGDRRKYHDDVSVMVISLEGRIWRSSG